MAVVVQKAYDWNLWILPKVEKFPKSYRFSVGQNLVSTSLDLLMNLVDATYQSKNSGTLAAAVRNVNRAWPAVSTGSARSNFFEYNPFVSVRK
jgi:hypothetical protein